MTKQRALTFFSVTLILVFFFCGAPPLQNDHLSRASLRIKMRRKRIRAACQKLISESELIRFLDLIRIPARFQLFRRERNRSSVLLCTQYEK